MAHSKATSKPSDRYHEGKKWIENVLSLGLVIPDEEGSLPIVHVTNYDSARCPFPIKHRSELTRAQNDVWKARNAFAAKQPDAFRVEARMAFSNHVGKASGEPYTKVRAVCSPISKATAEMVKAFAASPSSEALFNEAVAEFERQIDYIKSKI